MHMKKIGSLLVVSLLTMTSVLAQQENLSNSTKPIQAKETPVDGYVINSDIQDRKVVPYAVVRPADIVYSKRVWREIDLREKMNNAFTSPKSRLIDIILSAVMKGELTAYDPTPTENDPNGDSFKNVLPADQVMSRFGGDSTLVEEYDKDGNVASSHYEAVKVTGENVLKFRIKEDWIFDKQRSVFEPRIIGIAPLIVPKVPGVEAASTASNANPFDPFATPAETPAVQPVAETGFQPDAIPAFWIYFPEARHILVNKEVASRHNDATGLSYDDVFIKRMFVSYIVKQSNTEDLRIKDYIADDLGRLYESEKIKKTLMDYEQDLWSY